MHATDQNYRVELAIQQALRDLHFGSVEITVHDSKVVLIERREKVRLDTPGHHYVKKA
ncbi:MAG: putative small protein [Nitrospira sp.]|jgi:hypothetical protein|nr:putative small protein [Nitrospira sp.]